MKVSIVMATYNRAHLLRRSLERYAAQPFSDFELIIIDDWSEDNTRELIAEFASRLRIISITPPYKLPGTWRSEASIINIGLRASRGEVVIATHPEMLVGNTSIENVFNLANKPDTFANTKVYYLTQADQLQIDSVDWLTLGPEAIRTLPGFYDQSSPVVGAMKDYTHTATDEHRVWHSWMFGGMNRATWQKLGGFWEFESWGSVDVWFYEARKKLGIVTVSPLDIASFTVHQNHDHDGTSQRDMDKCLAALKGIPLKAHNLW